MPFPLEKSVTWLPQAPCASYALPPVHTMGLAGCEAALAETPLGKTLNFPFCLLTFDQRLNQGNEVWGDGSDIGTTYEEKGGKEVTLNWCRESSFHKCEIITRGIFKVQLLNPKVGIIFLDKCIGGIYWLLCQVFIYTSFILVCMNILSECCLRKDEGWLSEVFLTKMFEQGWLFILQWRLYSKLNIHILLTMQFL